MKIKTEFKKSGIYCIINIKNGHKYIGSSTNMYQRLMCHRSWLRRGSHHSIYLQRAWNKYGESMFECYTIEYIDQNLLEGREKFYINSIKPKYNMTQATDRFIMSNISKKKLSETRKRKMENGEIKITHNKIIHQYDLNGLYIASYDSIRKAAKLNNTSTSTISRFLNGLYKKGGGFLWSYDKKEKLKPYKKEKRSLPGKRVKVYNDTEYYEFDKLRDCSKFFNICEAYVGDVIKNKRHFKRKYMIDYICPVNQ